MAEQWEDDMLELKWANGRIAALEAELAAEREKVYGRNTAIKLANARKERINELEAENERLIDRVAALSKENGELKAENERLRKEMRDISDKYQLLLGMDVALADEEAENKRLRRELETIEKDYGRTWSEAVDSNNENAYLKQENERLRKWQDEAVKRMDPTTVTEVCIASDTDIAEAGVDDE